MSEKIVATLTEQELADQAKFAEEDAALRAEAEAINEKASAFYQRVGEWWRKALTAHSLPEGQYYIGEDSKSIILEEGKGPQLIIVGDGHRLPKQ